LIGSEFHQHPVWLEIIPRNYIATRNLASKVTIACQIVHTDISLQSVIKSNLNFLGEQSLRSPTMKGGRAAMYSTSANKIAPPKMKKLGMALYSV